jgi:hypothetical protein
MQWITVQLLLNNENAFEVVLVDVTETTIEQPKKKRKYYLVKKKRHIIKSQLVVDKKSKKIISTYIYNGCKHDVSMM